MIALARDYPIEVGILYSESRTGQDARYPAFDTPMLNAIGEMIGQGVRLSLHVCGTLAQKANDTYFSPWAGKTAFDTIVSALFQRMQFNIPAGVRLNTNNLRTSAIRSGARAIVQCRDAHPVDDAVDWLFDPSGGRGVLSSHMPIQNNHDQLVGYAGGIRPDNVRRVLDMIQAGMYWIDMESGVRTQNAFDPELCQQVCKAVYDKT